MSLSKTFACGALLFLVACSKQEPALYASSAGEGAYAERYPAMLGSLRARHAEDEQQARTLTAEFASVPNELKDPSWEHVRAVVEQANRAGKSADFAAGMHESENVLRFYAEERDTLRQKVGGSAEHAAKEKACSVELYGPIGGALDRTFERELEERTRARNVAQRYIEDHEDALGKLNVEKLEKQADHIALASYLVHVRLPLTERELAARLDDAAGVKKALERTQAEAKAITDDSGASKSAKQTAAKRLATAQAAQATLDDETAHAKELSDAAEKRGKARKGEYEKAFDALDSALEAKAKAQPKVASK